MKIKKIYEIMLTEDKDNSTNMVLIPFTESNCKIPRIINTNFLIFANDEEDAKSQARVRVKEILKLMKTEQKE